jgi:formylglycine-generating enzyme required for sulfatase activity
MKKISWILWMAVLCVAGVGWAADPVVSNLRVEQRVGTKLVDVRYDVSDAVRLRVDDSAAPVVPADMALIPAGSFQMGDTFNEGNANERPVHGVYVSAFYMDKYEVTYAKWTNVYAWATAHGYTFDNAGSGKATNHPVHTVNWYDVVKWCNARSEMEGLTPCFYTDDGRTKVYRTGGVNVRTNWVAWSAGGYRLPTEAEWEKAARGGTAGHRFPWMDVDTISHAKANYYSDATYGYDTSSTRQFHPTYNDGSYPYSSPVGAFAANGYGLYDMAGNMWEWCWDWYDGSWYSNAGGTANDTHGTAASSYRVFRGGSWGSSADFCRVAFRLIDTPGQYNYGGFRTVRASGQ